MKEYTTKDMLRQTITVFGCLFFVMLIVTFACAIYSLLFFATRTSLIFAAAAMVPYFFIEMVFLLLGALCFYAREKLQK